MYAGQSVSNMVVRLSRNRSVRADDTAIVVSVKNCLQRDWPRRTVSTNFPRMTGRRKRSGRRSNFRPLLDPSLEHSMGVYGNLQ